MHIDPITVLAAATISAIVFSPWAIAFGAPVGAVPAILSVKLLVWVGDKSPILRHQIFWGSAGAIFGLAVAYLISLAFPNEPLLYPWGAAVGWISLSFARLFLKWDLAASDRCPTSAR
ncbi:hypothetical protein [Sphingomonas immobilis]|uniref:Uncharacterized protein n=1 Tax=Sphingomonas immobilis TaxID=3063997 RepID=A0ABT9A0W5_9SPHN|nr:hypothetical protein [Sphingomonas sp. CA1-15]MDO7843019.1 hypothetical protein [Sphingomonas sp. CA1-15]